MSKKNARNYPKHTLLEALTIAQKSQDEMAGKPFKRLLLADAVGLKPSSSNFRDLLSSSYKYGLTEGTEKAAEISLTATGADASQTTDPSKRMAALHKAAMMPALFRNFFKAYVDRKLPSLDMMKKLLISEFNVPTDYADECARIIIENGRHANILRDIGGSPHVLLDNNARATSPIADTELPGESARADDGGTEVAPSATIQATDVHKTSKPIFLGHGKNHAPLEKAKKILTSFQIPFRVVIDEANLARPIPQKVKETICQCGSAILIFTCDE